MKMPGCVFVLRRIATANMPAHEALPQVDPLVAGFDAVFAYTSRLLHVSYFRKMWARLRHHFLLNLNDYRSVPDAPRNPE